MNLAPSKALNLAVLQCVVVVVSLCVCFLKDVLYLGSIQLSLTYKEMKFKLEIYVILSCNQTGPPLHVIVKYATLQRTYIRVLQKTICAHKLHGIEHWRLVSKRLQL